MEIVIAGIFAGVAVLYWRMRISKIAKRVKKKIPSQNSLIWFTNPDTTKHTSGYGHASFKQHWNKEIAQAGAVGVLGSIPSFYYLSQLDENVLEAMDFAFAQDLSNFHHLHDYINEKYLGILQTESAEGWMARLEGYVNEQYAADVLTKLGYDVEFPTSPNQEGWDLLVNGEPWQVKGGETPSVIADHLAKNPEIPVVTSDELKSAFPDQAQVFGFKELNPDVIHRATEQTLSAADNLGDTIGVGVPVVALVTSALRELKLLTGGKTDWVHSVKHVGIDVAGTGGGGFLGAKIGAAVGAAGGPVFMTIFSGLGAMLGAFFGRLGTNYFKRRKFKKAIEDYQNELQCSKAEIEQTLERKRKELIKSVTSINQQLNKARDEIVQQYQLQFHEWKDSYKEKQRKFVSTAPKILAEIKRQLQAVERMELGKIQRSGFLRRYIAPTENDLFYREANKWFATRYKLLDDAMSKFSAMPTDENGVERQYKEIIRFFREHPADHIMFTKALEDLLIDDNALRDRFRKKLFLAIEQAEKYVQKETHRVFNEISDLIFRKKWILEEKLNKLKKEGEKLGFDFNE